MDTKKLKEEIKLLERKIELMEQWTELQRLADEYNKKVPLYPSYPVYPVYPVPDRYPFYPQPIYPWDRVIYSGGTTTIPCESISAYNGLVSSGTTVINDDVQVSYTN
jgi:hypothetical protein